MNRYLITMIFLLLWGTLFAQQWEIKGKVTDAADKSGMPGVTIMVKGTATGTATDIDGNYVIKVGGKDILVFSFIGMKTQEVAVNDQRVLNIVLQPDQEQLDEVVVVGYTTRKKGTISGAVTTIKEDVMKVPVVSFDQALQGQVAGMSVMTSSGEPGASSSVRIRGVNSISSGVSPLYIMDGVAITGGDFSALNPNDIESITVLKDASSTSIYGARAANGVIVITTKRGKSGDKGRITYSGKFGVSQLAHGDWDLMNTTEKLNYEEMVGIRQVGMYDRASLEAVNVDWRDVLYNNSAPMMSHDLSISGAGDKSNYYVSAGYMTQDGISPASNLERYSLRMNLEMRPVQWLKAGVNTTLGYTSSDISQSGGNSLHNPSFAVNRLNPYYNPYNEDGSVSDQEFFNKYGKINPLATAEKIYMDITQLKLIASGYLEVKPLKYLTLKTQVGVDGFDDRSSQRVSPDLAVQNGNGSASEVFSRAYNLTLTNLATYVNTFNEKHNLTALLGQEALTQTSSGFSASGNGYTDDRTMTISTAPTRDASGGSVSKANFLSFFARGEYNYDYKYYLDLSFRRDGCSRFGDDNKWADFWSVGVMWDLKKENFLAKVAPLTSLQLSFNVGTSGNSSIGNYEHLAMVAAGPVYNSVGGIGVASMGNPELTWEKILSYNLGFKASLYNRVHLNLEFYKKITSDMLMSVPISMTSGFSSLRQNVGKMENSGVEVEVNMDVIKGGEFRWNLSANMGYNKNEITELYGGKTEYTMASTGTKLKVGEDVGTFYSVRFAGVDPENGDALWYTKDGGITNVYSEENAVLLDKTWHAPLTGGFTTTFSYKGVSLQAFFSWVSGKSMMNNTRYFTESNGRMAQDQQSRKMFNAWTPDNRYTDVPKYGNSIQLDDRLIEDASFMRLKNLTVAYDVPREWLSRGTHGVLSGVRIYGQGQNLLTWTNYSGLDPEVDSNVQIGSYPAARTFVLGIDVTF